MTEWPRTLRELHHAKHRRARLRRDVQTGGQIIRAGAEGEVWASGNSWNDLRFDGDGCEHCGVTARARGLSKMDLELLP